MTNKNKAVKRIGITGGIGSGKSEATDLLRKSGYTVIDADEAAREAAMPGELPMLRLREEVGDGVFLDDGSLDRQALARLMFADPAVLVTVNEIFHSDIIKRIEAAAKESEERGDKATFISVPLLYESGAEWMMDEVWLVTADDGLRLRRVMERSGLTEAEARARMEAQMPEPEKRERADAVIENNGSLAELHEKIKKMLE